MTCRLENNRTGCFIQRALTEGRITIKYCQIDINSDVSDDDFVVSLSSSSAARLKRIGKRRVSAAVALRRK